MSKNEVKQQNKFTDADLKDIWNRWSFTHLSSMSYEKLQGHAYAYSFSDIADKYYKDDPEGKRRLLLRHSQFFNTEPQTGSLIMGIVASLEEAIAFGDKEDTGAEEAVINIKTALMGPLAGIGDSLIQGIIVPILLSIGMGLASGGSIWGPIFYIVTYAIVGTLISKGSFDFGYKLGVSAIDEVTGEGAKRLTDAINILGVMVVGGLAATMISLSTPLQIPMGEDVAALQGVLDGFFPQLLPLIVVFLAWYLLSKKSWSATKVILLLTGIVIVGCLLGVF